MIDLHCHLLPGIDDGSKTFDESLAILQNAAREGITDIVITPHYVKGTRYNIDNAAKAQLLSELRQKAAHLPLNLYLGNEVFLDTELLPLIQSGQIATLNNSRYLLLELPLRAEVRQADQIIFELISAGYIPIIAHPERYEYFQQNPTKILPFLRLGCLMQGDYQSLLGRYGRQAEKTLKIFLRRGQIHLLASDTHHSTDAYHLKEAYTKTTKITKNPALTQKLFEGNPCQILTGQIINH